MTTERGPTAWLRAAIRGGCRRPERGDARRDDPQEAEAAPERQDEAGRVPQEGGERQDRDHAGHEADQGHPARQGLGAPRAQRDRRHEGPEGHHVGRPAAQIHEVMEHAKRTGGRRRLGLGEDPQQQAGQQPEAGGQRSSADREHRHGRACLAGVGRAFGPTATSPAPYATKARSASAPEGIGEAHDRDLRPVRDEERQHVGVRAEWRPERRGIRDSMTAGWRMRGRSSSRRGSRGRPRPRAVVLF